MQEGKLALAEMLLAKGADINLRMDEGGEACGWGVVARALASQDQEGADGVGWQVMKLGRKGAWAGWAVSSGGKVAARPCEVH